MHVEAETRPTRSRQASQAWSSLPAASHRRSASVAQGRSQPASTVQQAANTTLRSANRALGPFIPVLRPWPGIETQRCAYVTAASKTRAVLAPSSISRD